MLKGYRSIASEKASKLSFPLFSSAALLSRAGELSAAAGVSAAADTLSDAAVLSDTADALSAASAPGDRLGHKLPGLFRIFFILSFLSHDLSYM